MGNDLISYRDNPCLVEEGRGLDLQLEVNLCHVKQDSHQNFCRGDMALRRRGNNWRDLLLRAGLATMEFSWYQYCSMENGEWQTEQWLQYTYISETTVLDQVLNWYRDQLLTQGHSQEAAPLSL